MLKKLKKKYNQLQLYCKTYGKTWDNINTNFIISTGRTGTNSLAVLLNSISKNIYAVHEPYPDLFEVAVNRFRLNYNNTTAINKIKQARYRQLINVYGKFDMFIESNPNLTFISDLLPMVFPKSKFLIISRNYKDYLVSAYNKSPDGSGNFFPYNKNDHRKRIIPNDLADNKYIIQWDQMSQAEKLAWYYSAANEYLIKFKNSNRNVLWLQFEKLFSTETGIEEMKKIIKFFGFKNKSIDEVSFIKHLGQKINNNKTLRLQSYEDFSVAERKNIEKIVSPVVKRMQELALHIY